MLRIITGTIISYIIGSIPTAYIFGRLLKGVDIRKFGSGNVGATNAMRLLGKPMGITVLLLDALKGVAAVIIVAPSGELAAVICGFSCVVGHIWTMFLKFKGGKGMATTLGVLIGLTLKIPGLKIVLGIAILIWLVTFVISRIVSLASIASAICLPLLAVGFRLSPALISLSIILSALVVFRHKSNIQRLLQGREPRLNFRKQS